MKNLTYDRKPSEKKSIKAKAAKKYQPDIIYLGQKSQEPQPDIKAQKQ